MLRKILVPVDGSALSDTILDQVRRILIRRDAQVQLLRVIPEVELATRPEGKDPVEVARQVMEARVLALRSEGAQAEGRVLAGDPAERVLRYALEHRPDLIALSTHGRSGPSRWIRGSVAERILRGATVPVLIANPMGAAQKTPGPRFRKILVALDGSPQAERILPVVQEVATLYESDVVLMSSVETIVGDFATGELAVAAWNDAERLLEQARAKLDRLPAQRVKVKVVPGPASAAIVDTAAEVGADLLALTTHGRSGASRWLWGSVAEQVIRHAPCPLLVVRTAATSSELSAAATDAGD